MSSKSKKLALAATLTSFVGGPLSAVAAPDWANTLGQAEKCAGVVKAGQNDCGANGHACGSLIRMPWKY